MQTEFALTADKTGSVILCQCVPGERLIPVSDQCGTWQSWVEATGGRMSIPVTFRPDLQTIEETMALIGERISREGIAAESVTTIEADPVCIVVTLPVVSHQQAVTIHKRIVDVLGERLKGIPILMIQDGVEVLGLYRKKDTIEIDRVKEFDCDILRGDRGQVYDANHVAIDKTLACNLKDGRVLTYLYGSNGQPIENEKGDLEMIVTQHPAPLRFVRSEANA